MTPAEFTLKWEAELAAAKGQWEYASKKGFRDAELIEGARMQGIGKMMEEFYEAFKIMSPFLRKHGKENHERLEKEGWLNPEKE